MAARETPFTILAPALSAALNFSKITFLVQGYGNGTLGHG